MANLAEVNETRDRQTVIVETQGKTGMSVFNVEGQFLSGERCHWTSEGKYRMDGLEHPLDLMK